MDNAVGIIVDNETVSVASITDSNVTEGTDENHTITMSGAASTDKDYPFTLTDNTTDGDTVDYTLPPTFTNGVTIGRWYVTVPAGVTTFDMIVPTVDDTLDEEEEFYDVTIGGESAVGIIVDNDTVTVASITDSNVTEGTDENHTITMSGAASTDKDFPFTLTDNTTDGDTVDYTLPPHLPMV